MPCTFKFFQISAIEWQRFVFFRSYFNFCQLPQQSMSVFASSSQVHFAAVKDQVSLVEDPEYGVTQISPEDSSVRL